MNDTDLDKKLDKAIMETIWISAIDERVRKNVHPLWFNANGQTFTFGIDVERIKQLLRDASGSGNNFGELKGHLMTGRDWYDRFEEELKGKAFPHSSSADQANVLGALETCKEAAKRAAGLEKEA